MQFSHVLFALLSASSTTLAAPMDTRLEDIQCRCLSFSTDAKPTLCTYMESHAFDWHTASSLASDYDLKISFASQTTVSKVLAIHRPLPSSALQSIRDAPVMSSSKSAHLMQRENRIVCGLGDEVRRLGSLDGRDEPEYHFVGSIGAALMVLIALYMVAEYTWSRFFSQGSIKLDGDEKALMADCESCLAAQEQEQQQQHHAENAAPSDFS